MNMAHAMIPIIKSPINIIILDIDCFLLAVLLPINALSPSYESMSLSHADPIDYIYWTCGVLISILKLSPVQLAILLFIWFTTF